MSHRVIVDGRDLTDQVQSLTFSNVDPGGFEVCQSEQLGSLGVRAGAPLAVLLGGSHAWHGRLNEKGEVDSRNETLGDVAGVGYGAKLKDNPFSMVYIDRDLSRWGSIGAQQTKNLLASGFSPAGFDVRPDPTSGTPMLYAGIHLDSNSKPLFESFYDAGQGNLIGAIYFDWLTTDWPTSGIDPSAQTGLAVAVDDVASALEYYGGTNLNVSVQSGSGYFTPNARDRFALIFHYYALVSSSTPSLERTAQFRRMAVYGPHGIQRRGADPGGLYAAEIARDAAQRSGGNFETVIKDDAPFIVNHFVQYVPVEAEQYVDAMAKLQGYHWGVWEPSSVLSDRPVFLYAAPPSLPTCQISRRACEPFQSPSVRYDAVYNTAVVTYTDAAGSAGVVTVTLPHPLLLAGDSRTLRLDMGPGSAGSATAFATFALRLSQTSARGGGSATLPAMVALPGGGFKPSSLLRAGRDRIRILDLRDTGALLASDQRGLDTFLIRRVETTISPGGVPSTRIEFDGGADLMEVLNARLAIADLVAGGG